MICAPELGPEARVVLASCHVLFGMGVKAGGEVERRRQAVD
jgi:hypothetical protein